MRFRRPAGMLPLPVPELITERHSTVLSTRGWHDGTMNYPQRRFWRRGRLTMSATASANISDLHFMRWQSTRWINNPPVPGEGAWVGRDVVHLDWRRAADGFCISPESFAWLSQKHIPSI